MDRRTFARTLPAAALGIVACARTEDAIAPVGPPPPPLQPPPEYATASDRAYGVVASLLQSAQPDNVGIRWSVMGSAGRTFPTDLYAGQAGILAFLAEAYRARPDDALRRALQDGGRSLRAAPAGGARGVFDGSAGRVWAFLSLHEALGSASDEWLSAALALAPGVASGSTGLPGDIINGPPGQGLLLLRLHAVTGDARWLDAARSSADTMLGRAVESGSGIKIPSFNDPSGVPVCYTGLSHGSAGAAYFLCRLAQALPGDAGGAHVAGARGRYIAGAEGVAQWLDGLAQWQDDRVYWYRREPDQMQQNQVTWCHGPPGIGIFYAELHRLTRNPAHLAMAKACAVTVEREIQRLNNACLCHGTAGNAQLLLKLFRETGDADWLERARHIGELTWQLRLGGQFPAWIAGNGSGTSNPGLMTGDAGVGWFYLQMAAGGTLEMPVTG
jgi:lantibiotic modifying enzyme